MNRFYASLAVLLILIPSSPVYGQVPETISVQGFLTDSEGTPVAGPVDLTVSLYDAPSGGALVWTDTRDSVSVENGIYGIDLGPEGTPPFVEVPFNDPLWLVVSVEGELLSPPIALGSVPYALGLRGLQVIPTSDSESGLSPPSLVGGFKSNRIYNDAMGATISGGGDGENYNRVGGDYGTVGGGKANQAGYVYDFTSLGGQSFATVGGGIDNYAAGYAGTVAGGSHNREIGDYGTIAGGYLNRVGRTDDGTGLHTFGTIGGGYKNAVLASYGSIGGGGRFTPSRTFGNVIYDTYGTIGGGADNEVGTDNSTDDDARFGTIGGGQANKAPGPWATVGGGSQNRANDQQATVSGGDENRANGKRSTVGGGSNNYSNGMNATIAGGAGNRAEGWISTVPGGLENEASGALSFAAGWQAQAMHNGAFVWADSTDTEFASTADNQFLIRANGGVGIGASTPIAQLHVSETQPRSTMYVKGNFSGGIDGATVRVYNTATGASIAGFFQSAGTDATFIVKNTSTGSLLKAYANNNLRFHVDNAGNVTADGTITPGGADFAESFSVEGSAADYSPGDVLVVADALDYAVERSEEPYSTRIAGVYATKPGVLLAEESSNAQDDTRIPVGVVGVIPTKVCDEGGPIERGDLVVSSSHTGHAMRADPNRLGFGMVLGKALERFDASGTGAIKVLVMPR